MKKEYIAPASQLKMVAVQQMMAVSLIDNDETPAVSTGDEENGDALVKGAGIWDTEW